MTSSEGPRRLQLEIEVASEEELAALRGALIAARATELAEARRHGNRFAFGYGSETARETMSDTSRQRTLRSEMLARLIAALESEAGREG